MRSLNHAKGVYRTLHGCPSAMTRLWFIFKAAQDYMRSSCSPTYGKSSSFNRRYIFSPTSLCNLLSLFHNLHPPSQEDPFSGERQDDRLWEGGKNVHYLHFLYNQAVTFLSGTYPKAFLLLIICSWEFFFFWRIGREGNIRINWQGQRLGIVFNTGSFNYECLKLGRTTDKRK